jgi:hypothetical protein
MKTWQMFLVGALLVGIGIAGTLSYQRVSKPKQGLGLCIPDGHDCLTVRVREKMAAGQCDVDFEAVNLRRHPPNGATPDQIRWCAKGGNYQIHFTNSVQYPAPFVNNTNPIDLDQAGIGVVCSDWRVTDSGRTPDDYGYEVLFNGAKCADPKVILK